MDFLRFLALATLLLVSSLGWGGLLFKLPRPCLSSLRFFGGFFLFLLFSVGLALSHIYSIWAIFGFLVVGLLLAFRKQEPNYIPPKGFFLFWAVVVAVACFVASVGTAHPRDDHAKYFLHVYYLLNFGTLWGNPLSAIGYETFGAWAFVQAPFAGFISYDILLPLDFFFGTTLVSYFLFEFASTGGSSPKRLARPLLCSFAFLLFPCQVVNTTPVCLAVWLFLLVLSTVWLRLGSETSWPRFQLECLLAALLVTLLVFKTPFVLFPGLLVAAGFLAGWMAPSRVRPLAITILFSAILLSLWFLPVAFLSRSPGAALFWEPLPFARFWSTDAMFYGGSLLFYSVLVITPFLVAGFLSGPRRPFLCLSAAISGGMVVIFLYFLAGYFGESDAFRFVAPQILALFLFSFSVAGIPKVYGVCLLAFVSVLGLPFTKIHNIVFHGTLLCLPRASDHSPITPRHALKEGLDPYLAFRRSPEFLSELATVAELIPAGSSVGVYTSASFRFPAKGLKVYPMDYTGMISPAFTPVGLEYFLWERSVFLDPAVLFDPKFDLDTFYLRTPSLLQRRIFVDGRAKLRPVLAGRVVYSSPFFALFALPPSGREPGSQNSGEIGELPRSTPWVLFE